MEEVAHGQHVEWVTREEDPEKLMFGIVNHIIGL